MFLNLIKKKNNNLFDRIISNKLYFLSKKYSNLACLDFDDHHFHSKNKFNLDICPDITIDTSVSILGYTNRLRAFSLNLRDNNINVVIGLDGRDITNIKKAKLDGWELNKNILNVRDAINSSEVVHFSDNIYNQINDLKNLNYYSHQRKTIYFSNLNNIISLKLNLIDQDIDIFILDPICNSYFIRNNFLEKKEIRAKLYIERDISGYTLDTAIYISRLVGITKII